MRNSRVGSTTLFQSGLWLTHLPVAAGTNEVLSSIKTLSLEYDVRHEAKPIVPKSILPVLAATALGVSARLVA